MESQLEQLREKTSSLENQRTVVKENLNKNLKIRREELEEQIGKSRSSDEDDALKAKKKNIALMKAAISAAEGEERRIQGALNETSERLNSAKNELSALQDADAKSKQRLDLGQSDVEKIRLQKLRLESKKEDVEKKIRDVGSVPEDAFGKYSDRSQSVSSHSEETRAHDWLCSQELYSLLKDTKGALSKMTHVNKKAADQYMNFTEQKQEMIQRHKALIQSEITLSVSRQALSKPPGEDNIKSLIGYLDMQKDEAIERTFKGVAKHFRQIFSELVAGGTAELVMQKRISASDDEDSGSDQEGERRESQSLLERYSGVKVKV